VDEQGQWLYPFISWHDSRTTPQHRWWQEQIGAAKVFSIGGNPLWPINSALRILWLRENEPQILARTHKWLLIEDFLNFMLCGRQVTDYSMASCTLLFDQRSLAWSEEMLEASGIDRRWLCEIQPSGTWIGEVHEAAAQATDLPRGTSVVLGGHDHLCGALPVGAFQPGVVLDVTGTWETVMTATEKPILDDELRAAGMTVQAHVARDRYAIWGGNVAGEMVEWYRQQLVGEKPDAPGDWQSLMADAAASPPGAQGVFFLPHMSAAASPVVDPRSLGVFAGLSTRARRGDLLRAIVEGLNYQFLDIISALQASVPEQLERVIAVGGATRNPFWLQNKADVSGRAIEVPDIEQATPLGAAILAGIGAGLYSDEEDAVNHVYRTGQTYQPHPERAAQYARWFAIYRDLYPAVRSVNQRIFEEFMT
jgi:xylulokinase